MYHKGLFFHHGTALLNFGMQKLDFGKLGWVNLATNRCALIFGGKSTEDLPSFFPQKLTVLISMQEIKVQTTTGCQFTY